MPHINKEGEVKRQITSGEFNVTRFYGIDAKNRIFYQSSETHVTERNIYSIELNGSAKKNISTERGTHDATFTQDYSLFIDTYSAEGKPIIVTLKNPTGEIVRTLKTNERAPSSRYPKDPAISVSIHPELYDPTSCGARC